MQEIEHISRFFVALGSRVFHYPGTVAHVAKVTLLYHIQAFIYLWNYLCVNTYFILTIWSRALLHSLS